MKHLTTLIALMLCTNSFSQFVNITSVTYDSLTVYTGNELFVCSVGYQSNAVYYSTVHFIWSTVKEDISNRVGNEVEPTVEFTPGFISETVVYYLSSDLYIPMLGSDNDGIFFGIYYDVTDDQGEIVQSYTSPARTWRFPNLTTAVVSNDLLKKFSIYPNPTTANFQIDGFHGMVIINNLSAHTVLKKYVSKGESVDVSSLATGMYLLRGESGVPLGSLVVE